LVTRCLGEVGEMVESSVYFTPLGFLCLLSQNNFIVSSKE
jgi:hypothetical protein